MCDTTALLEENGWACAAIGISDVQIELVKLANMRDRLNSRDPDVQYKHEHAPLMSKITRLTGKCNSLLSQLEILHQREKDILDEISKHQHKLIGLGKTQRLQLEQLERLQRLERQTVLTTRKKKKKTVTKRF